MARARLASRFETLSAGFARLRQNLTFSFYRSPFGRGLWRGVNEPTLFDYPADLRPAIRCAAKAGWPEIILCAAACCAASAICPLT